MRTKTTRSKYECEGLRYASDLTDAECGVFCPRFCRFVNG